MAMYGPEKSPHERVQAALEHIAEKHGGMTAEIHCAALDALAEMCARMKKLEEALAPIATQIRAVFEAHHAPSHCALGLNLKVEDGERVLAALSDE